MKLKPVGKNQNEIERADGVTVFYSYQTPVAAFVPGRGCLCTTTSYSRTTSKHISAFVERCSASRVDVRQDQINKLAN